MGQSDSKSSEFEIPELFYVHQKKSRVLHIHQGTVTKLNFSRKLKIRQDSAIGFLSRNRIIVCGGTDSAGCLCNSVFIVDTVRLESKIGTMLPYPCANGFLFEFSRWVYYVGGMCEGDVEEEEPEVPAPLMRYSIKLKKWEVFSDKPEKKKKFAEDSQEESKASSPKVTDLKLPTVFIHSGKLYFVSGGIRKKNGKFVKNAKIFSLDLNEEPFSLKTEKFKLPKNLRNPVCVSRGSDVIITGGTEKKVANVQCWSLAFVNKEPEFVQEPDFVFMETDKHPIVYTGVYTVVFNFPSIAFLKNKAKIWEKIMLVQKTGKKPTPELNKTVKLEEVKEKKKHVKSAENLTKGKKFIDDESEEEKINPFPKLDSGVRKKKPSAFEQDSDG